MTLLIAHRGGRKNPPENSLPAFEHCRALGIDGIEFDVHLAADGEVVVMHDASTAVTTGVTGIIGEMSTAALTALPLLGSPDARVPRFDDVLRIVADTAMELHVELKLDHRAVPYRGLVEAVVARLDAHAIDDSRLVFTSFDADLLAQARALRPHCQVEAAINFASAGALGGLGRSIALFERIDGCIFSLHTSLLEPNFAFCRDAVGLSRLGVWTVNDADGLRHWLDRGVRHVITDKPASAMKVRAAPAA